MPREFSRSERVSSQIQRELASILQLEMKDPRIGLITVSDVELSRDLALAKVYISVFNLEHSEGGGQQSIDMLTEATPYIRQQLASRMRLRCIPELRFIYDDSIERGAHLSAILNDLKPSQ